MKKFFALLIFLFACLNICKAQLLQTSVQLKAFQQTLSATNMQFSLPKDFKEIKALHTAHVDVDYAMELPNANFQVWYAVKNRQQVLSRLKVSEDDPNRTLTNPDSLYSAVSLSAAIQLAGKDNFTTKNLPPSVLSIFHADNGKSYQLNLFDRPETGHFQYGLLISLQKNGTGYVSMLFLGNENGPNFYQKINKAYYSLRFN